MRKDIEDLIEKLELPTLGFESNYKCAEEYLTPDEKVLFIYPGSGGISEIKRDENFVPIQLNLENKKQGIFVITTNRIFHATSILGEGFEQIDKEEIVTYRAFKSQLAARIMEIFSNTRVLEVDLSYKKQIVKAAGKAVMFLIDSESSSEI